MKFNATYEGRVYSLQNGEVYTLRPDGRFAFAGAYTNSVYRVALTGYSEVGASGKTGWQTTSGGFIFLEDGWQRTGTAPIAQYSQTKAQALVDKICDNNKIIISNNLLCSRYAKKLSEEQQSLVRELQTRLIERNNALQAGGLTTDIEKSYPAGYAELSAYLEALMAGETIGVAVSTIVWIVVACVIAAGMGTAAYFAYKELADESERDVKYSKDLTRILTSKLTEEEYQQLLDETRGIVTKSKIKQALRSGANWMILIAAGALGYFGYKIIKNR